jgi:predicted nucleic acid-binding protein
LSDYIDTSVLVACYVPEMHSEQANRALENSPQRLLSDMTELEMHSALALKRRSGALSELKVRRILDEFGLHVQKHLFQIVRIESGDCRAASGYVDRSRVGLRSLDALHLAICRRLDAVLVTADKVMAAAAKEEVGLGCQFIG